MARKFENKERRKSVVLCYLTKSDKEVLKEKAKAVNLTQSDLIRLLILNLPMPDYQKQANIKELIKINADLSRLGNLFKLAIDEGIKSETEFLELIEKIKEVKDLLKQKIKEIK